MTVELVRIPGRRLAGLRHTGPFERITDTYVALFPRANVLGLPSDPTAEWVSVYRSDPETTAGADRISFATVSVDENDAIGDLEELRLAGGDFAHLEFKGPHADIPEAWKALVAWVDKSPVTIDPGPDSFSAYRHQADNTPDDELLTGLYLPVKHSLKTN